MIPSSLSAIDAAWLSDALGTDVRAASYEPMPGIVGALGEVGIFTIDAPGSNLPERLVGKCPLDDDMARLYDAVMQFYKRETGFYRDLARKVDMRVPQCFVNVADGERRLLLLEYVDGKRGDILEGAPFDTVRALVGDLARLHGRYWMDHRLRDLEWLPDWSALGTSVELGGPVLADAWTNIEPGIFPHELAEFVENEWLQDLTGWLRSFAGRPWTFVHGDYELDNMVFTPDGPVILDWQGCMRSFPGYDLGWTLASSATEETIAREGELLDHYRDVLSTSGGPAWSRDDVLDDLAWGILFYVTGLTIPATQDQPDERARRRFRAGLKRSIAAATRWESVRRARR